MKTDPIDTALEKRLTDWLKHQKYACGGYLNVTVFIGCCTGVCLILQAWLIAAILHGRIIDDLPRSALLYHFWALAGLIPVRAFLAFAREKSSFEAGARLRRQVRSAVLEKLERLGPAFIQGKPAGAWASIVLEQVEDLQDFYARYLPQMMLAGFVPLCILAAVFPLNWAAGLIFAGTAPLIPLFMILVGRGAAAANRKNFTAMAKLSGHFMDRLKGLDTLKRFNRQATETRAIELASESFREKTMSVLRIAFLSSAVLEFFAALSIALLAMYFGFSYLGILNFGHYGTGFSLFTGLFILMLAPEFYQPLRDLGTHFHAKAQAVGAAEELMTLLDHDPGEHGHNSGAGSGECITQKIHDLGGVEIQARDLVVKSHANTVLAGPLSFHLTPGRHMAVVGPSGCGKTSLINCLLGFLPYQGSVQINGVELKKLDLEAWRSCLAWLGQEPQLFHGSVRENVALGNPDMGQEEVTHLLAKARVLDAIQAQPLGLDHPVGEQMAGVSVGIAQRIALARALGQQARLYLLDEPTASLDRISEQAVLAALDDAMAGQSALVVTHRLDQLGRMDTILVMDQGQIVQQGCFDTLNQVPGLFDRMQRGFQEEIVPGTPGQDAPKGAP